MKKILVIHGPNLNLLGTREPAVYGSTTLAQINHELEHAASEAGIQLNTYQSNFEGELIDAIHQAQKNATAYIIINPAAFTHSSIAMRDALAAVAIPFIEVHLSNIHAREPFRQHSYFSDLAQGTISGFGAQSYLLALNVIIKALR
ncbi:MAG: type II 3-dehydroquinate dehydratase [Legionella sp.]